MGSAITARCKCGFESDSILVGGGMRNFKTVCHMPGVCRNCNRFVVANYLAKRPRCPECGKKITFYNDPSLQASEGESEDQDKRTIFEWNVPPPHKSILLTDTRYYCPKCGRMDLRFEDGGILWD